MFFIHTKEKKRRMALSDIEIAVVIAIIVKGAAALLSLAGLVLYSRSLYVRVPALATLMFFISIVPDVAQLFGLDVLSFSRLTAVAVNAIPVATLGAAVFKVSPSTWAISALELSASATAYTLASISTGANSEFRTGAIVVGGVLAIHAAVAALYSRSRYQFFAVLLYFVALAYYIVVLALLIYGPHVNSELSVFQWTLGWVIAETLFLLIATSLSWLVYIPTSVKMLVTDPKKSPPADIFNFWEYVLETGRFSKEQKKVEVCE